MRGPSVLTRPEGDECGIWRFLRGHQYRAERPADAVHEPYEGAQRAAHDLECTSTLRNRR